MIFSAHMRLALALTLAGSAVAAVPTFNKDVAPIFFARCVGCHRPNDIAPMSLLDYKSARPWAKSIKASVAARKMPPWFADPRYGHFANDHRLRDSDIQKIADAVWEKQFKDYVDKDADGTRPLITTSEALFSARQDAYTAARK